MNTKIAHLVPLFLLLPSHRTTSMFSHGSCIPSCYLLSVVLSWVSNEPFTSLFPSPLHDGWTLATLVGAGLTYELISLLSARSVLTSTAGSTSGLSWTVELKQPHSTLLPVFFCYRQPCLLASTSEKGGPGFIITIPSSQTTEGRHFLFFCTEGICLLTSVLLYMRYNAWHIQKLNNSVVCSLSRMDLHIAAISLEIRHRIIYSFWNVPETCCSPCLDN